MIISKPDDGKGLLYHVVNLLGETVHAYRDLTAANRTLEGDQRLFVQVERTHEWLWDASFGRDPDLAGDDHRLSAGELRLKYFDPNDRTGWEGEHPRFSKWDWAQAVASRSTLSGYWEWVRDKVEKEYSTS